MKDSHLKQKIRDQMEYERVKTWLISFPCCLFVSFSKMFLKIKIYFDPERKKRPNFIIDQSDNMDLLFEQKVFEMHHFYTLIIFHSFVCLFVFNIEGGELFFFFPHTRITLSLPDTVSTKESPEHDKRDSLIICKFISLIIQNVKYSAVSLCCQDKETVMWYF